MEKALALLLPLQQSNVRPYRDHRTIVNAWLWILNTGLPQRDLPERFGPWHRHR